MIAKGFENDLNDKSDGSIYNKNFTIFGKASIAYSQSACVSQKYHVKNLHSSTARENTKVDKNKFHKRANFDSYVFTVT